jgi:hypothetical protein
MGAEYEENFAIYVPYLFVFLIPLSKMAIIPCFAVGFDKSRHRTTNYK